MSARRQPITVAVVCALALSATACGSAPPPATPPAEPAPPASAPAATETPYATASPFAERIDFAGQLENFEATRFTNPTEVSNTWFPLVPGTRYTYEGFTEEAGQRNTHLFVLTVTDLTKEVMGVGQVVVLAEDTSDGELVEAELSLFAQSDDGNVWHFGEYPESYESGEIVEVPAWVSGIAGAAPGIHLKATPELGGPSYSQGWAPVVPWTDRARIGQVGVQDCVPHGCYTNGIVAEEFSREEPDAFQLKYYAPGLGNTRVDFTGQDQTRETLELLSVEQLDPGAMAEARTRAYQLEESAMVHSRAVWALTSPLQPAA